MKSKIICLVLSLVFFAGVFSVNGTYAWFIDYGSLGEGANSLHNFKSGDIDYVISGGFKTLGENERIQPEMELLESPLVLTNRSSVDTQLRVKVFYTYFISVPESVEVEGAVDGYLKIDNYSTVGTNAPFDVKIDGSCWAMHEREYDDCFYYETAQTDVIPAMADDAQTPQQIPLFTSMKYSGKNSIIPTTAFKDDNVFKVTLVFQAKQANYVEWKDIGEIEFTTDGTAGE